MESLVFKTQSERNIGKQRRSRRCGNYLNFGCTDFTCRYIQISAHKSGRDDFREDYKREQRYLKGEVTVYLSLVFILLISFAGAMLESASLQNVKNYRRADMTRAVESIFAEYQKELWEVYGIFALEGSYETGSYSEELLKERLAYYGASGMNQEITRIQLLTDQGASAFYEQVTAYMENKYGLDKVKKLVGQTDTWKAREEALQNYERDGAKTEQELQELLSQKEEFPEEENPLSHVAKLKSMPLVDLIMPKGRVMSKKSITLSEMVSHRKRNQGYGDFSDVAGSGSTISKLLFGEYVLEHFKMASDSLQSGNGNYNSGDSVGGDFVRGDSANEDFCNGNLGDMAGAGSLDYELEYILEGHASDRENLETVASKLLMVRFVPDYAYIQTDPEKKAEAEAAALTLCTVIGLPELAEGAAQGILLAWAYGEAIMDIRTLISGGKVPLVKNAEDWKLSLSGLMHVIQPAAAGAVAAAVEIECGRTGASSLWLCRTGYREYLRMLLFLKSQDEVGMRTLDMVEQNLKIRYGQTFFRADACISRVEFHSTCNLRRGIMYDFPTYFGYN